MVWHDICWQKKSGESSTRTFPSKYRSRCQAGTACTLGGWIEVGGRYVWDKSTGHQATDRAQIPDGTALSAKEAEDLITTIVDKAVKKHIPNEQLLNANIRTMVAQEVKKTVNPSEMIEAITTAVLTELQKNLPVRVEVKNTKGEVKDTGLQHRQFPILLKAIMARVNVWMAGPSGSGKTTAAMNAAKALDLPFQYCGAIGDPYALVGYNDANGRYVRTPFREAYEHGGVFLFDEIDASDPNALLAFNAALANSHCPFPDKILPKHKDCIMVAAANTWGHGASQEYVGRLKMDAAFLKRFAFISWDIDEAMELATAPNLAWTKRVQEMRKRVKEKGVRVIISPRESYIGALLIESGIPQDQVERMTIRSGCSEDQWAQLNLVEATDKSKVKSNYKNYEESKW